MPKLVIAGIIIAVIAQILGWVVLVIGVAAVTYHLV
jgi:hypothetical protein